MLDAALLVLLILGDTPRLEGLTSLACLTFYSSFLAENRRRNIETLSPLYVLLYYPRRYTSETCITEFPGFTQQPRT